jgi:hypothetical protein
LFDNNFSSGSNSIGDLIAATLLLLLDAACARVVAF